MSEEQGSAKQISIEDRLKKLLEEGKDWERKPTNIAGVFLLRMPQYKSRPPTLAVEINPVGPSGNPTKKKGVIIRSFSELDEIAKIVSEPKLGDLVKNMDKINPSAAAAPKPKQGVFEI